MKSLLYFIIFSVIRLKGDVNLFVRKFWKLSYFPSVFIFVTESFKVNFGGVSDLSICCQSLQIKCRISLYIVSSLTLERPSFSSNVIEVIRPG